MQVEHLSFDAKLETKAAGEDDAERGVFYGYGSVFGNVDGHKDIIAPGAFANSNASKVKLLWQHDARQPIGIWEELAEDSTGLRLKGRLALGTRRGAEAYELLKMGALDGLSIGFMMGRKDFDFDQETGIKTIKSVRLMEVSLVTFPANPRATTTGVKSATSKRELEHALRDEGLSASMAKYVAGLTQLPAVTPLEEAAVPSVTPDVGDEAVAKAASSALAALRTLNSSVSRIGQA